MAITHTPMVIMGPGRGVRVTGVIVDGDIMVPAVRVTGATADGVIMGLEVQVTGGIADNTFFGKLHYNESYPSPLSTT